MTGILMSVSPEETWPVQCINCMGPQNGKTYDQWRAYGQSKSANMLFSVSLAEKLAKKGLISVSLHPGAIMETNLANPLVEEGFQTLGKKHVPF